VYRIEEEQAEIVRRIFRMYAAGHGPVAIAKTMNGDPDYREESKRFFNGERPEKPIVGKRGCGSWAPTAIHAMLRNERYIGVLLYGRMKRGKYRDDAKQNRARQRDSTAIRRGGGLDALVAELRVVEESIRAAKAPTAHNLRSVSDARLARHLDAIAADWKKMMGRGGLENRNVIRAFLARPLELFPEGEDHYRQRGEVKVGKTPYGWCRGRDSNPHSVATART
jgi:Recombinase